MKATGKEEYKVERGNRYLKTALATKEISKKEFATGKESFETMMEDSMKDNLQTDKFMDVPKLVILDMFMKANGRMVK